MEFDLYIEDGISFKLSGLQAAELLKKSNIDDNYFHKSHTVHLTFSLAEVKSSKFLSTIFAQYKKITMVNFEEGSLNECANIKAIYDGKDQFQLPNAKIVFAKEVNKNLIAKNNIQIEDDNIMLKNSFYASDDLVPLYKPICKKYNIDWTDFRYMHHIDTNNEVDAETLNSFVSEFNNTMKDYVIDINKMKEAKEQEQKEAESKIAYNDMLLKKWKSGEIAVNIDTEKDNLTDVINFIKKEGDEPDFDFDEGMLKAFSDKGKFRIYMDYGDFAMDVYDGLPEITWNQLIGAEKIKPIERLLNLFEETKIGVKAETINSIRAFINWANKEKYTIEENLDEDEIQIKELIFTCKERKISLLPRDSNIKTYSWNQFLGLELLNLYSSTIKDFSSHEWVKFYEDEEGQPNVQWKEGCHNRGIEDFENFEQRVENEYGNRKEESIYRTYMLEADKFRLALNLPPRNIGLGGTIIKVCNFKNLFKERKEQVDKWITSSASESDDYYVPKNMMWLLQSIVADNDDFKYLIGGGNEEDDFYYDLITLNYLSTDFAIPVPIIAGILDVDEQSIYDCFSEHPDRPENNEGFI